ncbi:hypothetical protein JD969_19550 [Planctomycetota bacterium]|nr:hypothetical protein JD969_19550 [Planctomycetota bacterium]
MRTRVFNWMMVGLFVLWFAVIVPGHQRGAIALPGEKAVRGDEVGAGSGFFGGSSCPLCVFDEEEGASGDEPTKAPTERCAICYITGVLDVPLVVDLTPPPLWLVDDLPYQVAVEEVYVSEVVNEVRGRGPPIIL